MFTLIVKIIIAILILVIIGAVVQSVHNTISKQHIYILDILYIVIMSSYTVLVSAFLIYGIFIFK